MNQRTNRKKYLVISGWVDSINDGDRHYITCEQLVRLYGVNRAECDFDNEENRYDLPIPARKPVENYDKVLYPRYDGDYSL